MSWYWTSIADLHRPAGNRFIGVVIIAAESAQQAAAMVEAKPYFPRGHLHCMTWQCDPPPPEFADRLLDRASLAASDLAERITVDVRLRGAFTVTPEANPEDLLALVWEQNKGLIH